MPAAPSIRGAPLMTPAMRVFGGSWNRPAFPGDQAVVKEITFSPDSRVAGTLRDVIAPSSEVAHPWSHDGCHAAMAGALGRQPVVRERALRRRPSLGNALPVHGDLIGCPPNLQIRPWTL
jgi:hypothetical protein